ncbi:MAG: molecular chaperone TorD family protein [Desulfobacterales bacterium]
MLEGVALLSQLYWGPAVDGSRDLLQGTYLKPFEVLKPVLHYEPPDILSELKAINTSFSSEDEIFQCLEQTYVRLSINSRDGIAAPLYASCYMPGGTPEVDSPLMGPPAVMMKERFESKGLSLGDHIHAPPDHLSIELEYLYFLLERGWSTDDAALMDEAVSFSAETMLSWVLKFQQRLVAVGTECRFYQLITAILCAILRFIGASSQQ